MIEGLKKIWMGCAAISIFLNDDFTYIRVGETTFALNDTLGEFFSDETALFIEVEYCRKSQTVLPGKQRAKVVGEFFRKHGDNPSREIDGGTSFICLFI